MITFFPHGATADNEQDISSGWSDARLSEKGVQQSMALRAKVGARKFEAVFCSDLTRAVESARISFGGVAPIIVDARLRECNYGDYNAKPVAVVESMQSQMITTRFPNGESYEDVKARIAGFLAFLRQGYEGMTVAIVAHRVPQLALEVLLRGRTWEQALVEDWRKTNAWQPGWKYVVR